MFWRHAGPRTFLKLALLALAIASAVIATHTPRQVLAEAQKLDDPDTRCASCHQAIYASYRKTAMARGSGLAQDGLIEGGFHDVPSDIDYRVFTRGSDGEGEAFMSFARPAHSAKGELAGERRLRFFVGSGHHGRTYLYEQNGQWFELPINDYARRSTYAMAPAYDDAATMPDALPVDPNCLHCHATQIQPSLPEAHNRFASVPFKQGGIGCAACHGDPTAHLAQNGRGTILNPAKFGVRQRDSACIQCHLEGDAVVYKPGRALTQFRPGEDLSDIAVYFVRASAANKDKLSGGARATSQYEALLRSACKRAAGDTLTCTTCHDPHSQPSAGERAAYFRARCLGCHTGANMATHHPEQQDCAKCHMPSLSTSDITHEQVTDHDIEARPAHTVTPHSDTDTLVPVGNVASGERELGLAYAQLAQRNGSQAFGERALALLLKARAAGAHDPDVETRLGFLLQLSQQPGRAREAYQTALTASPYEAAALTNLAVLDASSGNVPEAIQLLTRLTRADPSQADAGADLAFIECRTGKPAAALTLLAELRRINPDNPTLRSFERTGTYRGQTCKLH